MCVIFLGDRFGLAIWVAIAIIVVGIIGVSYTENSADVNRKQRLGKRLAVVAFAMPFCYAIIDALGSFLDIFFLEMETSPLIGVTEESIELVANVSYELTFAIVGLVLFAISFGVAKALISGSVDLISVIVEPIAEVVGSLLLGLLMGLLFTFFEKFFHSRSKRLSMSVTFVLLTVALSMIKFEIFGVHVGFSSLLVCMMLGTTFCNFCDFSEELMARVDRWTAPIFILFFVISGAELELSVFTDFMVVVIGVVYIVSRCIGKYFGASISSRTVKCEPNIIKYLGITLWPQAGVALGMAIKSAALGAQGAMIANITLFSVLVYELVGPFLTKVALTKAGEIKPEEKVSAREMAKQGNIVH
jgi:hypothetical protein